MGYVAPISETRVCDSWCDSPGAERAPGPAPRRQGLRCPAETNLCVLGTIIGIFLSQNHRKFFVSALWVISAASGHGHF
eukprot:418638-Prymnesium_polylepis.1